MKKERNLQILFCILFLIYMTLAIFMPVFFKEYWFFCALFFLSIYLLAKAYSFRSDSSLFLGTVLMCFFAILCITIKHSYNFITVFSYIILSLAIGNLANFTFFHKIFNFYLFIFLILLFLPLILFAFYCINLGLMLLSICGVIVLFAIIPLVNRYE